MAGSVMMAAADNRLEEEWFHIRNLMRDEIGDAAFGTWLGPATLLGFEGGELTLGAPSRVIRDWIKTNYADRIRSLWGRENTAVKSIEVSLLSAGYSAAIPSVDPSGAPTTTTTTTTPSPVSSGAAAHSPSNNNAPFHAASRGGAHAAGLSSLGAASLDIIADATGQGQVLSFSTTLDPRFTFDSFIVGKPNELAYAAARRVADSTTVSFNPLFLYGGCGLGKTHLMHAIANHIRVTQPTRRVLYLSAEKFMYQFVKAVRYKDTHSFKELFRSVDVLMIDDVQFIIGREATQDEFFHTFNALVDQNRQVIISADKSPSDLAGMEERLRSRLGWGLVADLHPTNYELRLGILQSKAERMGHHIPEKVLEFLAHKITSNVRELEGALNRIVAHAELVGRPLSIETAQEVLQDLLRAHDRRISIDEIQRQVATHYNIRLADMASARRSRVIARPRQVAMYLAKLLTPRSLPEIGRKFGGRDHTTVMHAVKVIEELRENDPAFAEDVELLRRTLEG